MRTDAYSSKLKISRNYKRVMELSWHAERMTTPEESEQSSPHGNRTTNSGMSSVSKQKYDLRHLKPANDQYPFMILPEPQRLPPTFLVRTKKPPRIAQREQDTISISSSLFASALAAHHLTQPNHES